MAALRKKAENHSSSKPLKLGGKARRLNDKTSTYESLRAWILQLPRVTEAPHRVGGTDFQVDGVEFMHSHGPSWLDIRLSKEDQASALKAGQALPHRAQVHAQAGWVSFRIENSQDLVNARTIIQLAYENAKKNLEDVKAKNAIKLR
jgi:hypothetical protein